MTPQEAADIAVACTATGQSGLPLWQYLPGMLASYTIPQHGEAPLVRSGLIISATLTTVNFAGASTLGSQLGWLVPHARVRPDFDDALTVQALWLLVRRAYHAARVNLTLIERCDGTVCLRVTGLHTLTAYDAEGPAYAVFTRALQKAPTR